MIHKLLPYLIFVISFFVMLFMLLFPFSPLIAVVWLFSLIAIIMSRNYRVVLLDSVIAGMYYFLAIPLQVVENFFLFKFIIELSFVYIYYKRYKKIKKKKITPFTVLEEYKRWKRRQRTTKL